MEIRSSKPDGWLNNYINMQLNGLTGHIGAAGYPFDHEFWGKDDKGSDSGVPWWPFEQTAYHIDGYIRAAILADNSAHLKEASKVIYLVLNKPDKDGYLGPASIKEYHDNNTRWSHVVFFRACLALYEYNHDEAIINALVKHYLAVPYDYAQMRSVLNVEIMLELYRITKNTALLELAKTSYDNYNARANEKVCDASVRTLKKLTVHGVTYNEYAKLGAMMFMATGDNKYLKASVGAYKKLQRHYLLPGGSCSSSEVLSSNRYDDCSETCNAADMTWTLHYLAEATDDVLYSDLIEQCVFNAGIGCVTEDFKALQYFSCANQLVLNEHSSTAVYDKGGASMSYAPNPFTACCPGNVNRIIPNYIMNMWSMKKSERGTVVTARMYGPGKFYAFTDESPITVLEKTSYPFDLNVCFEAESASDFWLRLRIPGWCSTYKLSGTGFDKKKDVEKEGSYVLIRVKNHTAVSVNIEFNAEIEQRQLQNGVYFKRGPLVYALGMKGERAYYKKTDYDGQEWYSYSMSPNRKWNYAIDTAVPAKFVAGTAARWDLDCDLPHIEVSAREVTSWKLQEKKNKTPLLPRRTNFELSDTAETLHLFPYGACKLRMTVLPDIAAYL